MTEHGKLFNRLSLLMLLSATMVRRKHRAGHGRSRTKTDCDGKADPETGRRPGPGPVRKDCGNWQWIGELTKPDGSTVSVKITDKTQYHKDQQAAKLGISRLATWYSYDWTRMQITA